MPQPDPEPRETERRRATVMFADLTGFTSLVEQEGDEQAYEVVASCLKLLDEIARRLAEGRGPDLLDGRDAGAWRAEARELLVELALERELEVLDAPASA